MLDHKADLMARLNNPQAKAVWRQQVIMDMASPSVEVANGEAFADAVGALDHGELSKVPSKLFSKTLTAEQARGNAAAVVESFRHELPEAAAYHVSEDMGRVVTYAASQLDDLDQLDRTILPTRSGIARFEGGLPFRDVRGRAMKISWAVWCPVLATSGHRHDQGEPFETTLVFLFNDHREEPDDIYAMIHADGNREQVELYERTFGRWGFIGAEYVIDGMRLGPAFAEPDERKRAEVLADGDTPTGYTNALRLMHAFWLMLGQTITDLSDAPVDRARRKRTGRMGIPDRVTVVQLRNVESKRSDGESLVEWSHRWVVRGFWRWQACGPNHPQAQEMSPGVYRARIWIAPFVKGPKDKPLVVTDKVYALHR